MSSVEIKIKCRNILPWPTGPCAIWPLPAFSVASLVAPPTCPSVLLSSAERPWCCQTDFVLGSLHFHFPLLNLSLLLVCLDPPHLSLCSSCTGYPPNSPAFLCPYPLADSVIMLSVSQFIERGDLGSFLTLSPFLALCLAPGKCSVHIR